MTCTMTGIDIGSIESGKSIIGVHANGTTHATTAAAIAMIGVTTINAASSKATGTMTMKTTVGEVTNNANGTDRCVRRE